MEKQFVYVVWNSYGDPSDPNTSGEMLVGVFLSEQSASNCCVEQIEMLDSDSDEAFYYTTEELQP